LILLSDFIDAVADFVHPSFQLSKTLPHQMLQIDSLRVAHPLFLLLKSLPNMLRNVQIDSIFNIMHPYTCIILALIKSAYQTQKVQD